MIALNTAVAMQLTEFHEVVEKRIADGETKEKAIFEVLKTYIEESAPVHFDGNGYCDDWKAEAARRRTRLRDLRTVDLRPHALGPDRRNVQNHRRALPKRNSMPGPKSNGRPTRKKYRSKPAYWATWPSTISFPLHPATRACSLDKVFKLRQMLPGDKAEKDAALDMELIEKISMHQVEIQTLVQRMVEARKVANQIENEREKAIAYHDTVASLFDEIRYHIDKLELIVDNEMWPLPKYRELLFIR